MTKNHLKERDLDRNSIQQIFLDLDMSIVASERSAYEVYTKNVRKEYKHFNDEDFVKGRTAFLKGLEGVTIFRSELFEDMNKIAEENIKWELENIEKLIEVDL